MALAARSVVFGSTSFARPCLRTTAFVPASVVSRRPVVQVQAMADDKKAQKKRTPAPVKRAMLATERRMYNKARKSACATKIKKVLKMAEQMMSQPPKAEADVKPIEELIADCYQEIDKAVGKGVLHLNNAARKKSRVAKWKRMVLMNAGMFQPSADHPDYAKYQRMQAKAQR